MLGILAIVLALFLVGLSLGVIAIPDRTLIRLTTDNTDPNNGQQLPTMVAGVAQTNPGPVMPATTQDNAAGNCIVIQAVGAAGGLGYLGYNIKPSAVGEPCGIYRGVVVDGFTGVVPQSPVYVDVTNSADAGATNSGLTHTANGRVIGVGITSTKIRFE